MSASPVRAALLESPKPVLREAVRLSSITSRPLGPAQLHATPSTLPLRLHRRVKPPLSTDNEAVAAQHGRCGPTGARPGGGGGGERRTVGPSPAPARTPIGRH